MPSVSVLMPCYNCSGTIDSALDSIFHQTISDYEIVAVDDGSSDSTLKILQQHSTNDNRLKIIPIDHTGIVGALNHGLEHCSAPYIARMDSDDIAHPERLEMQVSFLNENPQIGLVSCRVEGFPAQDVREGFQVYLDWLNGLLSDEEIKTQIFIESPLPHPSVLFRAGIIQEVGSYLDHGWPEDYDLWLRMYNAGVKFTKLPEVLLRWREYPDRLTRTDSRYSLENFLRAKAHYLAEGPLSTTVTNR